jgi:hypothetical protein
MVPAVGGGQLGGWIGPTGFNPQNAEAGTVEGWAVRLVRVTQPNGMVLEAMQGAGDSRDLTARNELVLQREHLKAILEWIMEQETVAVEPIEIADRTVEMDSNGSLSDRFERLESEFLAM